MTPRLGATDARAKAGGGDPRPSRIRGRLGTCYFERLYREQEDPWQFETSEYERAKYERTLAALGDRRYGRALEVGCSIGVLTALLAERCDELLAVDLAPTAVERARARLTGHPQVRVELRALPEDLPPGPWDLILCSEVLYYWPGDLLERSLPALQGALAPGGVLLAVHWRPPTRTYPLRGDEVHDLLESGLTLRHVHSERTPRYRLDRFEK